MGCDPFIHLPIQCFLSTYLVGTAINTENLGDGQMKHWCVQASLGRATEASGEADGPF